jgi:DNA polymerase II large subunit
MNSTTYVIKDFNEELIRLICNTKKRLESANSRYPVTASDECKLSLELIADLKENVLRPLMVDTPVYQMIEESEEESVSDDIYELDMNLYTDTQ